MTRGFERQVTESQSRVSTLNWHTQLGMTEMARVGKLRLRYRYYSLIQSYVTPPNWLAHQ